MRELDNKLSKIDMNTAINSIKQDAPKPIKKNEKHSNVPDMLKCYICEGKENN